MPAWLEISIAALLGAIIGIAGVALFFGALIKLRRRLYDVETYLLGLCLLIAPVIGGAVGVAVATETITLGLDMVATSALTIVAMSALIGGIAFPILESASSRRTNRSVRDLVQEAGAGLVLGAIIGVFLATVYGILRAMGWV